MFQRFLSRTSVVLFAACLMLPGVARASENVLFESKQPSPNDIRPHIAPFENGVEVESEWPTTIFLARVDVKKHKLDPSYITFSADVAPVKLQGTAALEIWLHFPDKGFVQTHSTDRDFSKDGAWKNISASFFLRDAQPDEVILTLRMDGRGRMRLRNMKLAALTGSSIPADMLKMSVPPDAAAKKDEKAPEKAEEKAEEKEPEKTRE